MKRKQGRNIIIIVFFLIAGINLCNGQDNEEWEIFIAPETLPRFENKEMDYFLIWIYENLKYPDQATQKSLSGKVYVHIFIDSTGILNNIEIKRSAGQLIDTEVIRVLELSPKFTPARMQGKNIGLPFTFPIEFDLSDQNFKKQIEKIEKRLEKSNKKSTTANTR